MLLTAVSLRDKNVFFIKDSNQGATKKNNVKTMFVLPFESCTLCSYNWYCKVSREVGHSCYLSS